MRTLALPAAAAALMAAFAAPAAEPVTVDNFNRAETHFYMNEQVKAGCFGVICHERGFMAPDKQSVVRLNRDTLYSFGVFDLASPLSVTLPEPAGRLQSLLVISEDHYNPLIAYGPARIELTQEKVGSRYAFLAFRTFVDPNDPADMAAGHRLQDALAVTQAAKGSFEIPDWDLDGQAKLRDLLKALFAFSKDPARRFGKEGEVDEVRHLIATAAGWGGNPTEAAIYVGATVPENDGETPYTLTLADVPVDAFWSVTVYNEKGFYEAPEATISVNSVTAKKEADGSAIVRFGGPTDAPNHLRIMPGWNYIVRLYRPRQALIDGSWKVPDAVPAAP
jgi:hypothetical protein